MKNKPKYELVVYHGSMGIWQRVKKVNSIREAQQYLKDKRYHSADLFRIGEKNPVRRFD